MIKRGIEIKAALVEQDEKETGIRAYLNFGHTLGHAVEASMGYGNFTHGESVLIGMVYALELSRKKEQLEFEAGAFVEWVQSLGYRTTIPKHLRVDQLLELMKSDKKSVTSQATLVLLKKVGSPLLTEMDDDELLSEMANFLEK
jgi:3-dehydroquinate synthase